LGGWLMSRRSRFEDRLREQDRVILEERASSRTGAHAQVDELAEGEAGGVDLAGQLARAGAGLGGHGRGGVREQAASSMAVSTRRSTPATRAVSRLVRRAASSSGSRSAPARPGVRAGSPGRRRKSAGR